MQSPSPNLTETGSEVEQVPRIEPGTEMTLSTLRRNSWDHPFDRGPNVTIKNTGSVCIIVNSVTINGVEFEVFEKPEDVPTGASLRA